MAVTYASQRSTISKAPSTANQPFAPIRYVVPTTPATYTRPADWLTMPTLTAYVDSKIVLLGAIFNDGSNFFSIYCAGSGPGITIDWGDGAGPQNYSYSSGEVQADRNIAWSSVSSGTLTSRGYRQTLVTVTAQAGGSITTLALGRKAAANTGTTTGSVGWLDIAICMNSLTIFTSYNWSLGSLTSPTVYCTMVETINFVQTGTMRSGQNMFYYMHSLQQINGTLSFDPGLAGSTRSMFEGCYSLQRAPSINMPACSDSVSMFYQCYSLLDPGNFSQLGTTATYHNYGQMFYGCQSLQAIPPLPFNGARNISWSATFQNCYALESAPVIDVSGATAGFFNNCFNGCYNIRTINMIGTLPASNSFSSTFSSCYRLVNLTLPGGMNQINNITSMFASCVSLEKLGNMDFSNASLTSLNSLCGNLSNLRSVGTITIASTMTSVSSAFSGCPNLISFGGFIGITTGITNTSGLFQSCSSLRSVPDMAVGNLTTCASMFNGCSSLRTAPTITMGATNSVTSSASMFANCYSLTSMPTINLRYAAGSTAATMFSGCTSLVTAPAITYINACANTSSMFTGCSALLTVPAYDMAANTTMASMFQNCYSLQQAPAFTNTSLVTSVSTMFATCRSLENIPAYNLTGVTSSAGFSSFANSLCGSLSRVQVTNTRFSISYSGCRLAGAQLDEIYTNLPTITAQTITVTNNWGTATDTPTIATAKGWTVTGT